MADPFVAEIRIFPFNFAPKGWAWCDGQLMPLSQNTALFSLLGTTYGGNGKSNFALPDIQGRAVMHPGQGPGLSLHDLGETGGSETVTLLQSVTLRPADAGDEELLLRIYASTRAEELAVVPWDEAQKEVFLRAQFDAQDRWYREHYAGASFDVVLVDREPCGRLYVYRGEAEIRIVDIALLPEQRGNGVGSSLLRDLLDEADAAGKRVTIHVERLNPALGLYERLGFSVAEDKGVYLLLERLPRYVNTAS